ncbi:MAG TPA: hypothetical protein VF816_04930 [Rhodocyclaceae bacterium]
MQSSNTIIPDFYFSAFRSMVDVMNVYLGGLGRLQAYQLDAMQQLRGETSDAARQADPNASEDERRAAQSDFARGHMERVAKYWGGLYSTAYQNHIDVIKEAQSRALQLTNEMRQRLESSPQGAEPMMSAMRLAVDAAQSTYQAGIRATEEVERMTAAHAESAAGAAKSAAGRAKRAA